MPLRIERLREIRERRGWTQRELARMCGLAENMIYRYEGGKVDPTAANLTLIAEHLGVSADYLLGLASEPEGQYVNNGLNPIERDLLNAYRREGWSGVMHLVAEQIGKK